jgi:hypothetical protein
MPLGHLEKGTTGEVVATTEDNRQATTATTARVSNRLLIRRDEEGAMLLFFFLFLGYTCFYLLIDGSELEVEHSASRVPINPGFCCFLDSRGRCMPYV